MKVLSILCVTLLFIANLNESMGFQEDSGEFHLIISDYNMPQMDGIQLLQQLRASPKTKAVGFILITGRTEQQIIDHGKRLGMNNYLKKPFEPIGLRNCIESVVGRL